MLFLHLNVAKKCFDIKMWLLCINNLLYFHNPIFFIFFSLSFQTNVTVVPWHQNIATVCQHQKVTPMHRHLNIRNAVSTFKCSKKNVLILRWHHFALTIFCISIIQYSLYFFHCHFKQTSRWCLGIKTSQWCVNIKKLLRCIAI